MPRDYSHLMKDKDDKEGCLEFSVSDSDIFNSDIKEVTLFYNIVGNARFKLFRNNKSELVLVHVTDDWMRQAKVDISKYNKNLGIRITWNEKHDILEVKGDGETKYIAIEALQIDN
ncbi:MAG: hypothetical protein LRZ91_05425 [Desulfotomaculum sp.]|nr:hypothetical protein [Desulfotomaculum sp.]